MIKELTSAFWELAPTICLILIANVLFGIKERLHALVLVIANRTEDDDDDDNDHKLTSTF